MSIIGLLVLLLLFCLAYYVATEVMSMFGVDARIHRLVILVIVVLFVLYLIQGLGFSGSLRPFR